MEIRVTRASRIVGFLVIFLSLCGLAQTKIIEIWFQNIVHVEIAKPVLRTHDVFGSRCGAHPFNGLTGQFLAQESISHSQSGARKGLWSADFKWLQGDCAAALEIWQASRNSSLAISFWASIALGNALYDLGQFENAVVIFKQAHLGPFLYQRGYQYQLTNNWRAAIQLYQLSLAVQPSTDAVDRLFELYTLHNNSTAIYSMWQRLASNPDMAPNIHWFATAELLALDRDWDGAIVAYRQALKYTDQDTAVQYDLNLRLARILQRTAHYAEAVEIYQLLIQIAPTRLSEPYRNLGEILALQGDFTSATDWFDKARKLFPRDPLPDIQQGMLASSAGRIEEAKQFFRSALAVSPDNAQALIELGKIEEQLGNVKDAVRYFERANNPFKCDIAPSLRDMYRKYGAMVKASALDAQITELCAP